MKKSFTLLLLALAVTAAFAQQPEGVIRKAPVAPKIDGVLDTVWNQSKVYNIDKNFQAEVPTVGKSGETTWKALWDDKGVYVFIKVNDDSWRPAYGAASAWLYDKVEIYFDVNYVLKDLVGPMTANSGHYQVAPDPVLAKIDGTATTETNGVIWAYKVDAPTWIAEYFVPFSLLLDKEGVGVDKTGTMGFDVTISDKDAADDAATRRRAVWANVGAVNESWANMDDCGLVTFDGAVSNVYIEKITLAGGTITKNNDTLRIKATILPVDATVKTLRWTVENKTGRASISSTGLLTAIMNGVVTVIADATDGSYEQAKIDVTISGQVPTLDKLNVIKNGLFNQVNADGTAAIWGGWYDLGSVAPQIIDGVAVCTPVIHATEGWHYQYNQTGLTALPNIPYEFKFKAWAAAPRTFNVDFESADSNYLRYGASASGANGRSDWTFNVTTQPTWYKFDVNFDQMTATTPQKVQFMLSLAADIVYIDSVYLVSLADKALLTGISDRITETFQVYPNPAVNELNVILKSVNTKVSIYNGLGVKMEEVVVPGTRYTFDVSSYAKGLYFVKANNNVVKFLK